MKIFDFKENKFIALIFMLIGAITLVMYYLYNRINILDNNILKHNEILNNFITDVRDNLHETPNNLMDSLPSMDESGPPSKDASELAKTSAENYLNKPFV